MTTMVKKLFLCALACIAFTTATADEGMWLPSLIKERINDMRKMGFKLKAEDIYSDTKASLKDAVVQFGGGCTGEFISAEALNAATLNSACAMGESKDFGSITRGKVANFNITKPLQSLAFLPYAHQTPVIEQIVLKGKVYPVL